MSAAASEHSGVQTSAAAHSISARAKGRTHALAPAKGSHWFDMSEQGIGMTREVVSVGRYVAKQTSSLGAQPRPSSNMVE